VRTSLLLERFHGPDRVEEHHAGGFHLCVRVHDAEGAPVGCDEHIARLPVRLLGHKRGRVSRFAVPEHEQKAVDGGHRNSRKEATAGPPGDEGPGSQTRWSLTPEPAPLRAYETLCQAASGRFRQVRGVDPAISRCGGRQSISGLLLVAGGHRPATMLGYRRSLLPVVWIVVGIVVAAIYDYFDSLGTVGRVLTAATAVLLWPILLFGFDIRISR
jgi:hypothetical protein